MIKRANKRLWILRRLKNLGADIYDLVDVYIKQERYIVELAVPAWQGGLSQAEKQDLERVQKTACHIILGQEYISYSNAFEILELNTLEYRRNFLTLQFALKAEKHKKLKSWFKINQKKVNTRKPVTKYYEISANHARFENSPLSYLTKMLDIYYRIK